MRARGGIYVITGATSGIGLEAARRLAATADRLVVQGPEPEGRAAEAEAADGDPVDHANASLIAALIACHPASSIASKPSRCG